MEERAVQLQRNLSKFINHVEDLTNEEDPAGNGFYREYRDLREIAAQHKEDNKFPSTVGREPYNLKKNRYKDIVAYDYSRVKLQDTGVEGSDYINANLIQDPYNNDGYIASQGPLTNTVDDFWRMIVEYKVKVVIMACKLIEGNKKKCAVYWPESVGDEEQYGDVVVRMTNESDMKEDCTVRVFEAWYGDWSHQVTQYHYTGWPDHGIPEDRDVILAMVAKMRDIRHKDEEKAPILVHCSAGCGRTGTVCAIDYAWELLRGGKLSADFEMKQIVESMREQRQSMIQTPDQYEMAHLAVKDLFQKHLEIMEENIYMNFGVEDDNEEQSAPDSLPKDDEEDVYSYPSAAKVLQESLMDTINMYTMEGEIGGDILQPVVVPASSSKPSPSSTSKPVPPTNKPAGPTQDISMTKDHSKDEKPARKKKYQNVDVVDTSYENVDLLVVKEEEKSPNIVNSTPLHGGKFSPQLEKKMTPPSSPVKKQHSGPVFTEQVRGPVFSEKKPDGPLITGKQGEKTDSLTDTNTPSNSVYSVSSNKPSGPTFSSEQTSARSGPSWSPAPSTSRPRPVSNPKPKPTPADPQTKKHITKITVGGAMTSAPINKKTTEPNNNLYSVATNSQEEKPSGPAFSTSTGGDIYSVVQKDRKGSPQNTKRSSQRQSKPTTAPHQDGYSQVRHQTETGFQGHILGGNGSYSEVVIGSPAKVEDSLYSYVAGNPPSPDDTPPVIPEREYNNPPREPPPRGPVHTETLKTGQDALADQNRKKNMFTRPFDTINKKFKGDSKDHQYTDTSNIKGFGERIGKKPKGKREEPSRWKKMFKNNK